MSTRLASTVLAAALLLLSLGAAATASAASPETLASIYQQCQRGAVRTTYTPGTYRQALDRLPTDVREYTTCVQQLRRAAETERRRPDLRISCRLVDRRTDVRCTVVQSLAEVATRRTVRADVRRPGGSRVARASGRGRATVVLRGARRLSADTRVTVGARYVGTGSRRTLLVRAGTTRTLR